MKASSLIALVLAVALIGCGKPEDKFIGKYDGKLDIPQETLDQIKVAAVAAGATAAQVEQQIKSATFGMELMKEGNCRVVGRKRSRVLERSDMDPERRGHRHHDQVQKSCCRDWRRPA